MAPKNRPSKRKPKPKPPAVKPSIVVVEARGGVIQEVYSDNPDLQVVIIDWDEAAEPGGIPGNLWEPSAMEVMDETTEAEVEAALKRVG